MTIVPLKIALPLLIVVPILIWTVGTRRYDFVTPPPDLIVSQQPTPQEFEPEPKLEKPAPAPVVVEEIPEEPEIPVELGDTESPPALDEYIHIAELDPNYLLRLAVALEQNGHVLRSLLAFQRIIDSTPAGGGIRAQAQAKQSELTAHELSWNAAPEPPLPIRLTISTNRPRSELSESLEHLSQELERSSGGICKLETMFRRAPQPLIKLPNLPIALWFTVKGEDPSNPPHSVITINPRQDEDLLQRLAGAFYELTRQRLQSFRELTPPPLLGQEDDSIIALNERMTWLMWHTLSSNPFMTVEADSQ